ncbi:MAG: co-chaperone GroES [Calditrichia bacterium]
MKKLIVIGDRILIKPNDAEEKTEVGLILPQTVRDRDDVMRGEIIKTGPGLPMPDPSGTDEPWQSGFGPARRYVPMEARVGDHVLFLRKAAVEIKFESEKYLIAPQSAILLLVREDRPPLEQGDAPLDFD